MSFKSLIARLLAVAAVIGTLAFGFTPAANAAVAEAAQKAPATAQEAVPAFNSPKVDSGPSDASSVCGSASDPSGASQSALLPVTRWRDATGLMHHRLDNTGWSDQGNIVSRDTLTGTPIQAGNTMWDIATNASAFAVAFCPLDTVGGVADKAAASIGNAFKNSALMTGLLVAVMVFVFWRGRRTGAFPLKTILAKALIVGLFVGMTIGATNSTGGQGNADYSPGVMSPGWLVSSINRVVSSLASAPAAALAANSATALQPAPAVADSQNNSLSCINYTNALKADYNRIYGGGATQLSAGIPQVLSAMWETTGLASWRTAQFGASAAIGSFDDSAWCHMLDWNSPTVKLTDPNTDNTVNPDGTYPVSFTVAGIMRQTVTGADMSPNGFNYSSKAFAPTSNDDQDRSVIAWAACQLKPGATSLGDAGSWVVKPDFKAGDQQHLETEQACADWFTKPSSDLSAFDWTSNADKTRDRTAPPTSTGSTTDTTVTDGGVTQGVTLTVDGTPSATNQEVRTFIETLHGNDTSGGVTAAIAYLLASLMMLIVFGSVAIGIILAKIALVVMIFMVMVLLIVALAPQAKFEKVLAFLKTVLGISVYVFGIQLVFAFITVITGILQMAGSGLLGGGGSIFSIFWTGLSPVIAVVLIGFLFTKVLKVPHPFKISSALAWGSKASEAGGSVMSGFQGLADWGHKRTAGALQSQAKRGMGAAKAGARNGMNAMLSKATGGKLGRRGSAAPVDTEKTGRGAAASSGASAASKPRNGGDLFRSMQDKAASVAAIGAPGAVGGQGTLRHQAEKAGQDPMVLASSGVPNSKLTSGLRGKDRKMVEAHQKQEVRDAKAFAAEKRSQLSVPAEELSKTRRRFQAVMEHKGKIATVAGAGLALGVAGPVAAVGVVGAVGARALWNNRPSAVKARSDSDVDAYRAAVLERDAIEKKKAAEEEAAAKAAEREAKKAAAAAAASGGQGAPVPDAEGMNSRRFVAAAHSQMNDNTVNAPRSTATAPVSRH